jgi:Na+/phosphate symporter
VSETFDIWKLIAGLGIFLIGMYKLEDAIKILSGKAFRRMIRLYTNGRFRSIGSGTLVTALAVSASFSVTRLKNLSSFAGSLSVSAFSFSGLIT